METETKQNKKASQRNKEQRKKKHETPLKNNTRLSRNEKHRKKPVNPKENKGPKRNPTNKENLLKGIKKKLKNQPPEQVPSIDKGGYTPTRLFRKKEKLGKYTSPHTTPYAMAAVIERK